LIRLNDKASDSELSSTFNTVGLYKQKDNKMLDRIKDKDLIKRAASETGYYHKPNFYKSYIKENFQRDVTASHIVKTLGTFKNRIKRLDYQIAIKVIEILDMANNDINLVNNITRRIYNDRSTGNTN
jgi:hypothetical protein